MPTSTRFLKLLLWVALLLVVPVAAATSSPASALAAGEGARTAGCKTANQAGNVKLGSKVSGDLVTICASKALLKKLTKPAISKPAIKKPVVKPPVAKKPTITKPAIKKPAVKRPATKPTVVVKKKRNSSVAAFRAVKPLANRSPLGVLAVGQQVTFQTRLSEKLANTTLLGQPVQVRFTPNQASWLFGDGTNGQGVRLSHSYVSKGMYQVELKVRYAVAYRAVGGKWIPDETPIWLSAVPLAVPVGVNPPPAGQASVVLIPGS